MRLINLLNGILALVDDDDFDRLSKFNWCLHQNPRARYATTKNLVDGRYRTIYMHRFIMNAGAGEVVDHIDHNGLNNQKSNLRICTQTQNLFNGHLRLGPTGLRGVTKSENGKRYHARVRGVWLGTFDSATEAAIARDAVVREQFGEICIFNSK